MKMPKHNTRPLIVLDKSALFAKSEELRVFASTYDLLLISVLAFEIETDSRGRQRELRERLQGIPGYWAPEHFAVLEQEISHGRPLARSQLSPNSKWRLKEVQDRSLLQEIEDAWRKPAEVTVAVDDPAGEILKRKQKPAFYSELAARIASTPIAAIAKREWMKSAVGNGKSVSKKFRPGPGWLSYGFTIFTQMGLCEKHWRYPFQVPPGDKGLNQMFDGIYLSHLSIADGIISGESESGLLHLAWAGWPEKRNLLFLYDSRGGRIQKFIPETGRI